MATITSKLTTSGNLARKLNAQRQIAQSTLNATVLIEYTDAPIIACKAKQDFVKNGVAVKAGQQFFLVRSGKFAGRYYVVAWNEMRTAWQCSCGADCRQHAHTVAVKSWIAGHVVAPKREQAVDPVRAKIAQCVDVLRQQAIAINDSPAPQTAAEWKAALARQKEADKAYNKKYLEEARALRAS